VTQLLILAHAKAMEALALVEAYDAGANTAHSCALVMAARKTVIEIELEMERCR
jgi:hypothetical protein